MGRRLFVFFFNDTATTEIYTLSLHDALPISPTPISDSVDYYTIVINPVPNTAPVAIDDSATTDSLQVIIDVQSNDIDPEGDPLTTTIAFGPSNGTASVMNGDSILYTADSGFSGIDTIIYSICDNGSPQLCDTAIITINVSALSLNITVSLSTDVSCNGSCDGYATATPSGGMPPYTFLWNDGLGQTTATATGLCAGNYTVTVYAGFEFAMDSVVINEPSVLTITTSGHDVICYAATLSLCQVSRAAISSIARGWRMTRSPSRPSSIGQ